MSDEQPPYNQLYINAWTALSAIVALVLFGMLVFGGHLLNAGHIAWNLIRWLATPII